MFCKIHKVYTHKKIVEIMQFNIFGYVWTHFGFCICLMWSKEFRQPNQIDRVFNWKATHRKKAKIRNTLKIYLYKWMNTTNQQNLPLKYTKQTKLQLPYKYSSCELQESKKNHSDTHKTHFEWKRKKKQMKATNSNAK